MYKKIICVLCCIFVLFSLTACERSSVQKNFDKKIEAADIDQILIAENENYRLECNKKNYGVILTDLKTGDIWGTSPPESDTVELDEFGLPKERSYQVESPFIFNYLEYASNTEVTALAYEAVTGGRVRCKGIKNGLRVEYYFDSIEIMIPVQYVLYDDYVGISIEPKDIQENKNKVIKISLAPFWCSAENDGEDSYLFVPSGSGAVVIPKTLTEPIKNFTDFVYGEDYAMEKISDVSTGENILLPVYGAKTGNTATCAVIDKGAESALIGVDVGDSMIGYSSVYAAFQIRGYTSHISAKFSSDEVESTVYCDSAIETPVSVRYYPISGDGADYCGMAEIYRDYLCENYGMTDMKADTSINLTVIGGTMITKSFLGVPYSTLYCATDLKETYDIYEEVSKELGVKVDLKLKGFGDTGVDIGSVAGNYKLSDALGNKKDLKALYELLKDSKSDLYMDFDLLRYSSSGGGFSPYFDSISTAGDQKAYQYLYDTAVNSRVEETLHYLLSPSNIKSAVSKLVKKCGDFSISGYSLETVSGMLYSDYSDKSSAKYYARSETEKVFWDAFKTLKKDGKKFMATEANAYAAACADVIVDAPTNSTGSYIFDYDVPFYSMVFKGYIPIASQSINLSRDADKALLKAVESGCGLNYTVTQRWDNSLIDAYYPYFYNSVYSDIRQDILSDYERLSQYYEKVSGAHIIGHRVLSGGLRETVFDNGVTVYVNYSDMSVTSPVGEIAPYDFLVAKAFKPEPATLWGNLL